MSRTYITSPTTFYVDNVAGNDTTGDGSAALPWQTIQHAVDKVQSCYDFAAQPTIQLATTGVAYNEAVVLARYVGSLGYTQTGYTYPKIQGDTTNNAAVIVAPTTGAPFTSVHGFPWIIDSLKISSQTTYGIIADEKVTLLLRNPNFGYCGLGHMCAEFDATIETLNGPYTISGTGPYHITAVQGGRYISQGNAITFTQIGGGAWPQVFYFAMGGSGARVTCSQMSIAAGQCYSYHPNQINNDGTALMYPMANGLWP